MVVTDFGIDRFMADTEVGINHIMADTEVGTRQAPAKHQPSTRQAHAKRSSASTCGRREPLARPPDGQVVYTGALHTPGIAKGVPCAAIKTSDPPCSAAFLPTIAPSAASSSQIRFAPLS